MTILAVGGARNSNIAATNATTRAYDLDGNLLWSADHGTTVYGVAVGPDDSVVAVGNRTGSLTTRKYDSAGNLLWSRDHGNSLRCVTIDIDGNIYTGGSKYFSSPDVSIRKYDSDGTELWNAVFDGFYVYGLAVDSAGNVYAAGSLSGGVNVKKFDSAGSLIWSRAYHTNDLYSIAATDSGNVAVCGLDSSLTTRVFDADGVELWSVSQGALTAQGIAYDQSGAVYVGGWRSGTDYSSRKHNGSTGSVLWTTYHGNDTYAVAVKTDGSLFFEGGLRTTFNTPDTVYATHRKYDGAGSLIWSRDFGGSVNGIGLTVEAAAITSGIYDHTHALLASGGVDWDTDTIKLALVHSDYAFDAAHTEYSDLSTAVLATATLTTSISNSYLLTQPGAFTGLSGSANALVIYKDATVGALDRPLLAYQALSDGSLWTFTDQGLRFNAGWANQQFILLS